MRGYSTHSIFGNGYNSGNVKYAARDICRKAKLKMGMVFQNFPLFPHKTALENLIEAPILLKKTERNGAVAIATELLQKMCQSKIEMSAF